MKIIIAPDSFKESLTALEVAEAIEAGLKTVLPHAECVKIPMADGGEGTVQSLIDATAGTLHTAEATALPRTTAFQATAKPRLLKWRRLRACILCRLASAIRSSLPATARAN